MNQKRSIAPCEKQTNDLTRMKRILFGGLFLIITATSHYGCGGGSGGNSWRSSGPPDASQSAIVAGDSGTIHTLAGTGSKATDQADANADNVLDAPISALSANFDTPMDMTMGPDGRLYVMDWNGHKVRALGSDGTRNYVAFLTGTGIEGDACTDYTGAIAANSDGSCPAAYAQFNHMTNVTFDSSGRMVVAAWHNAKIKRIDFTTGTVNDLCGTGNRKFEGDGGPCDDPTTGADRVSFDLPSSVVYDSAGNLFISDQANQVIRRLGTDGIIKTIAGNCPGTPGFGCPDGQGYDGDGGPAASAHLRNNLSQATDPQGKIALGPDGSLYIADTGNNVIRKVVPGADGIIGDGNPAEEIITTVAGTGVAGYSGDGGPAASAMLNGPRDIEVTVNGTIYIADTGNNCVRKIDPSSGNISTVAGQCGEAGAFTGDGGPATLAAFNFPYGIELDTAGNLYIADTLNNRIRVVYK
jgi:hypothetical protein